MGQGEGAGSARLGQPPPRTLSDHLCWCPPRLQVPCDGTESEMNHLYPAFAQPGQECFLQKEPLLFSCAGSSSKYRRLCPCRDFRKGQVALCQDCL